MRARGKPPRASSIPAAAWVSALCLTAVALTGCATVPAPALPASTSMATPTPSSTAEADAIPIGVVGDSLASGGPWDSLPVDPGSWTQYLDSQYEVAGGWRRDGATSGMMADNLVPFVADAVVIMAGTNDIAQGVPTDQTLDNVQRILEKSEVHAVVLCAIPPSSAFPDRAATLNTALVGLARQKGWTWVDPWAESRQGTKWRDGASPDGIHGSLPSYAEAATRINDAIGRALEGSPTANAAE